MAEHSSGSFFSRWYVKYIPLVFIYFFVVCIFSGFMIIVTLDRTQTFDDIYSDVNYIYEPIKQIAPSLNKVSEDSLNLNYREYGVSQQYANNYSIRYSEYLQNTNLISTNGSVVINADFVKKGLIYQPTYKTIFTATYVLENSLAEESLVSFDFPFPSNLYGNREISDAVLKVGEEIQPNSKGKIQLSSGSNVDGMRWEGKVPANGSITIEVSYSTVGLSSFQYEGFENTKGAQDFDFKVTINGTRNYNIASGLSVDKREFSDNQISLIWAKDALYSRPDIDVSVGDKLAPSMQVSRVYGVMPFLYLPFILALIFIAKKFGKEIKLIDVTIVTVIFLVFFPLFHYLSSFTIDPTIEIFTSMNIGDYSMPLYTAFIVAFVLMLVGYIYLMFKTQGARFFGRFALPLYALAFGYFPLVATLPEYFGLLTLVGIVFLIIIGIQVRLGLEKIDVK